MSIFSDLDSIKDEVQKIKRYFAPEVRGVKQEPGGKPRCWFCANNYVGMVSSRRREVLVGKWESLGHWATAAAVPWLWGVIQCPLAVTAM